ncbi:hypothetical protein, partial [Chitinivorax sp. B]|uniref:hypothetical protein n=1 Tax=Chitinivorax sp. B TaxID=2502235 RepID=UPI001485B4B6
ARGIVGVWSGRGIAPGITESLASRNVWKTFNGQGIDLGGGAYGPNTEMIAQVLSSAGPRAGKVAEALRSGELELAYRNLPSSVGGRYLPNSGEVSLNRNMNWSGKNGLYDAVVTAAHEGQHWMDDMAGIASNGMKRNEMYFEARAFLTEQRVAHSLGKPELSKLHRYEQKYGSREAAWQKIKEDYGYGN